MSAQLFIFYFIFYPNWVFLAYVFCYDLKIIRMILYILRSRIVLLNYLCLETKWNLRDNDRNTTHIHRDTKFFHSL